VAAAGHQADGSQVVGNTLQYCWVDGPGKVPDR